VQNRFNLADRSSEDVLDHCEKHGIGFIPWYPLAAGKNLSFREVWNQRTDQGAVATPATYTVVAVLLTDEPNGLPSAPARISIE